jgi:hypothetical protein
MSRLRDGDWIAGAGGIALLATLFLPWYGDASAWAAFAIVDVVLASLTLVPLALVGLQASRRSPALPVAFSVFSVLAGVLATLLILWRLLDQPGPSEDVSVRLGAWLGLLAALAIATGGWRSLRVEAMPGAASPPIEDLPVPGR